MIKEDSTIKLSIIIPYHKTLDLLKKLLKILIPQLTKECELIIVDDDVNTYELDKFKSDNVIIVHHKQNSGCAGKPRNTALDIARGTKIVFIDSDDSIPNYYIKTILNKMLQKWDYCIMSWRAAGKLQGDYIIKDNPPTWNTAIWNCVYDGNTLKNLRFSETKIINEDTDFNIRARRGTRANIEDVMYIYNSGRVGSITDDYCKGKVANEVLKKQIIIYRSYISLMGGVETAIYNACLLLKDKYDIMVLYDTCDATQLSRLKKLVHCVKNQGQKFECEKFIYYSLNPTVIENYVEAQEYIQMICCDIVALNQPFVKSKKITKLVADSQATVNAYMSKFPKDKCEVLYNLFLTPDNKKAIHIMSATRLSWEKGYDTMKVFAKRMIEKGYPFLWTIFTNDKPDEDIDGFIFMKPRLNVTDYMDKDIVTFGFQGSKSESWGGTITEFLSRGIPVICTEWASVREQIQDGVNGFILKQDLSNMDEVIDKMFKKNLKGFKYDKKDSISQWEKILGKGKKSDYVYDEEEIVKEVSYNTFIALVRMKDEDGNIKNPGEKVVITNSTRLKLLFDANLIQRVEE